MSKQVLSIEQMRYLSNLIPLRLETDFIWWRKGEGITPEQYKWELHCWDTAEANPQCDWIYPAYTLQDIIELLPIVIENSQGVFELRIKCFSYHMSRTMWAVLYEETDTLEYLILYSDPDLLTAAYEFLCHCIKYGFIQARKEIHP